MRESVINKLEVRKTYFFLGYYDRNLSVPFIETYFFIGKNIYGNEGYDCWYFQSAQSFLNGIPISTINQSKQDGITGIPQERLEDFVDWQGLVNELTENKKLQDQGKFFSQR